MAVKTMLAFLVPTLTNRLLPTSGKPAPARFLINPIPASAEAE